MGQFLLPVLGFFALLLLFGAFFTVKQQTAAIIERFGKLITYLKRKIISRSL